METNVFRKRQDSRKGFTLVELLVVIAIIGILIALLLPAIQAAREAARRMNCTSNQKQICLGITSYEDSLGNYPCSRVGADTTTNPSKSVGQSGFVSLLPYVELQSVYDMFDTRVGLWTVGGVDYSVNYPVAEIRPPVFVCPSDDSPAYQELSSCNAATGSYAFCAGTIWAKAGGTEPLTGVSTGPTEAKYANNGVFYYQSHHSNRDVSDGLSQTIFIGEVVDTATKSSANLWTRGARDKDCHRTTYNPINTVDYETWGYPYTSGSYYIASAFASRHAGGANFGFGDGHVEFLSETIDMIVYQSMSTRAGGETIDRGSN